MFVNHFGASPLADGPAMQTLDFNSFRTDRPDRYSFAISLNHPTVPPRLLTRLSRPGHDCRAALASEAVFHRFWKESL
jgi:hypothetical protein